MKFRIFFFKSVLKYQEREEDLNAIKEGEKITKLRARMYISQETFFKSLFQKRAETHNSRISASTTGKIFPLILQKFSYGDSFTNFYRYHVNKLLFSYVLNIALFDSCIIGLAGNILHG